DRFGAALGCGACDERTPLTPRHHSQRGRGPALQPNAEQVLRNVWHRRSEKVSDKQVKTKFSFNKDQGEAGASIEQPAEAQSFAVDTAKADVEMTKLTADLEELRQTLLRRQADFENYRK